MGAVNWDFVSFVAPRACFELWPSALVDKVSRAISFDRQHGGRTSVNRLVFAF